MGLVFLLAALVVLSIFVLPACKQPTPPPRFLLSKHPRAKESKWVDGRTHHFRSWETQIFLAQPACHTQGVRLDESKVLSERKNFEWVGS
jgi:hypothetical protein